MATLSSNMVNVGVSMVLNDQFSARAGRITDSYKRMMGQMRDMNQGISMSMGAALDKGVEAMKGMYGAYEKYASIQDNIFLVTKMTGTTMAEGNKLMDLVKEINKQTPATGEQIASGAKYLAMAGNSMENIKAMLPPISKLSSILGHEIGGKGGTADLLTNIMIGMDQPMSRVNEIVDMIGAAVTGSNMSLTDFAQTMQYASASARTLKIPIEDMMVTAGMLGNMGIQGSRAGTEIKNAYENMVKTIGGKKRGGQEALASIGLSTEDLMDSQGNMLKLADIAVKVGEAFKKQGITSLTEGVKKKAFFFDVFGMRGQSAMIDLVDQYLQGVNNYQTLYNRVVNSKGFIDQTNEERMRQAAGIIAQFKAAWENFVVTYGGTMAPLFNTFLYGLGKVLNGITTLLESGFFKQLAKVLSMVLIAKTLFAGFKMVRTLVGSLLAPVTAFAGGIGTATAGVNAMNTSLGGSVALLHQMNTMMSIQKGLYTQAQMSALAAYGYRVNSAGMVINSQGQRISNAAAFGALMGLGGPNGIYPKGGRVSKLEAFNRMHGGPKLNKAYLGTKMGRQALSQASGAAGTIFRGGVSTGKFVLIMAAMAALTWGIDKVSDSLFGNKESTDENTDALNGNTNSLNDMMMAREKALVEAITKALNKDKEPNKQSKITVVTEDGRVLGEMQEGGNLDLSLYGIY